MVKLFSKFVGVAAVAVALAAFPSTSSAITIGFVPSTPTFEVGEFFDIDVVVSDVPAGQIVSAYDVDVIFDETVLGFSSLTFGSDLLLTNGGFTPSAGALNVFETSLFTDDILSLIQTSTVVLFTIEFQALAVGSSMLDFGELLVNGKEDPDKPLTPTELQLEVVAGEVGIVEPAPEPASTGLLALALVAGWIGRLRRHS